MNAFSDFVTKVEAGFQYDEQWLVAEVNKAIHEVETVGYAIQIDIENVFKVITSHAGDIQKVLQSALQGIELLGSLIPSAGSAVTAATVAVDAMTAAIDALSKHVVTGTTPVSTIVNAVHAVQDAKSAVAAVVKAATPKPSK